MSREAFEKWANLSELVSFANNFDRRGEGYHDPMINLAWWAWQAALSQQAGEAVAVIDEHVQGSPYVRWLRTPPDAGTNLYTSPQPAVPAEPTKAMLDAARDWSYERYGKPIGDDAANRCWKAMLAAAPEPQR